MVLLVVKLYVVNGMKVGGVTDQVYLNVSPAAQFQQIAGY